VPTGARPEEKSGDAADDRRERRLLGHRPHVHREAAHEEEAEAGRAARAADPDAET
jgi:hypothetical protein